jgi:hypothetical protein
MVGIQLNSAIFPLNVKRIGSVMVSILASSAVNIGLVPRSGHTKDYEMVFAAFLLSAHLSGVRANIGWFGIRIMCPSGATCLFVDVCFSDIIL